jgi:hypothetical protein
MSKETPAKVSIRTRGRKASAINVSDHCRLCKCALKLKYGAIEKISYISSENFILLKASKRNDYDSGKTLAELCSVHLGIEVSSSPLELSDRVCKQCGRKIALLYIMH